VDVHRSGDVVGQLLGTVAELRAAVAGLELRVAEDTPDRCIAELRESQQTVERRIAEVQVEVDKLRKEASAAAASAAASAAAAAAAAQQPAAGAASATGAARASDRTLMAHGEQLARFEDSVAQFRATLGQVEAGVADLSERTADAEERLGLVLEVKASRREVRALGGAVVGVARGLGEVAARLGMGGVGEGARAWERQAGLRAHIFALVV
jgi:chromosome segregation ATPase